MNLAPDISASNTHDAIKGTYQKWPNDRITMGYFFESSKEHEFNCKFDDAQWKKILQILKEFFCASQDVSLVEQQSLRKKVQKNHAWANKSELTKESKVNLV